MLLPLSPFPVQVLLISFPGWEGRVPGLWSRVLEKSGKGRLPRTASSGDLSPAQKWMGRTSEFRWRS